MPKASKITIFSAFSAILAFLVFYFYSHQKNNLTIENSQGFKETGITSFRSEPKAIPTEEKEDLHNFQESENENKPEEIRGDENKTSSIKITSKLVTWGYSSSKNRLIDTVIIHTSYNALGGDYYDLNKLLEEYKKYGVSPHYLIDREGKIYQLVKDQDIAYHAGESKMEDGRTNVNNFSLGIELMNTEDSKMTENQYYSLKKLLNYIKENHKIENILGHNQIAAGRKTDPWNFEWDKIK